MIGWTQLQLLEQTLFSPSSLTVGKCLLVNLSWRRDMHEFTFHQHWRRYPRDRAFRRSLNNALIIGKVQPCEWIFRNCASDSFCSLICVYTTQDNAWMDRYFLKIRSKIISYMLCVGRLSALGLMYAFMDLFSRQYARVFQASNAD